MDRLKSSAFFLTFDYSLLLLASAIRNDSYVSGTVQFANFYSISYKGHRWGGGVEHHYLAR
jgi:hypothetical protein